VAGDARLLGGVKMAAKRSRAADADLERQVVRAVRSGCSYREVAAAAQYDSHHKVQQIVTRAQTST